MKLLCGGSPCTYWSISQVRNRETEASGLGWELFLNYVIAKDKYQPDYFLYENNKSMSAAIREQITQTFGFEPVLINSALVSAQNRQRLYWVGKRNADGTYSKVDIAQPEDKGILLRDILEPSTTEKGYPLKATGKPLSEKELAYMFRTTKNGRNHFDYDYYVNGTKDKSPCLTANVHKGVPYNVCVEPTDPVRIGTIESGTKTQHDSKPFRVYSPDGKSVTLQGEAGGLGAKTGLYATPTTSEDIETGYPVYHVQDGIITIGDNQYPFNLRDGYYIIRKLTVTECKRLQTVPEDYEFPVSATASYKLLGNGWTVDVISHIMSHFDGITDESLEVLSMYDGMSCARIALEKLGATIERYYATEVEANAIKTTLHNFSDTIELGDAYQVRDDDFLEKLKDLPV
jgi:DNA (cytosine-5)-methyltransferase 3A